MNITEYKEIDKKLISTINAETNFNIYYFENNDFKLFASSGLNAKIGLKKLKDKIKSRNLYIHKSEKTKADSFLINNLDNILKNPEISNLDKSQIALDIGEHLTIEAFRNPKEQREACIKHGESMVRYISESEENSKQILKTTLESTIEELRSYDDYTAKHGFAVATYATILGKELGFNKSELKSLFVGGILHDHGKTAIPLEILNKPDKLTDQEMEIMKKHPEEGVKKLVNVLNNGIGNALYFIYQHHETENGIGYPKGLSGKDIHKFGRVGAIADVYDALTSKRPYKDPMNSKKALRIMEGMFLSDFFHKPYYEAFKKMSYDIEQTN